LDVIRRERYELNAVIQAWKDDYIFLLQSCITVPNCDVVDGWRVKLFGGDAVSCWR